MTIKRRQLITSILCASFIISSSNLMKLEVLKEPSRVYLLEHIKVSWNGIDLSSCWADDTFLTIEPLARVHKIKKGGLLVTSPKLILIG